MKQVLLVACVCLWKTTISNSICMYIKDKLSKIRATWNIDQLSPIFWKGVINLNKTKKVIQVAICLWIVQNTNTVATVLSTRRE